VVLAVASALWAVYVSWWPLCVGLGWLSVSLLIVGTAYLGAGPKVLMKSGRGSLSVASWFLLGPFHLLNALIFGGYRRLSREPASAEIIPGLYLGRRLWVTEARAMGADFVLDLTCEMSENRLMRDSGGYHCLPVLDNGCPSLDQLREGVAWLGARLGHGRVYVHCAAGHGRSATLVVAYLLSKGVVGNVEEGIAFLRARRPGVRLNRCQRAVLQASIAQGGGLRE
jgi:protein-tyrosine phosphatase